MAGNTAVSTRNKRKAPGSRRVTVTLTAEEYEQLKFWASHSRSGPKSINEYLHECISHMIDYENGVYNAPDIMQERMNLVVDAVTLNTSSINSLHEFVMRGFSALITAARGDDYLSDSDVTYGADGKDGER